MDKKKYIIITNRNSASNPYKLSYARNDTDNFLLALYMYHKWKKFAKKYPNDFAFVELIKRNNKDSNLFSVVRTTRYKV